MIKMIDKGIESQNILGPVWKMHGLEISNVQSNAYVTVALYKVTGPLLLTWFNFNPSMDK